MAVDEQDTAQDKVRMARNKLWREVIRIENGNGSEESREMYETLMRHTDQFQRHVESIEQECIDINNDIGSSEDFIGLETNNNYFMAMESYAHVYEVLNDTLGNHLQKQGEPTPNYLDIEREFKRREVKPYVRKLKNMVGKDLFKQNLSEMRFKKGYSKE